MKMKSMFGVALLALGAVAGAQTTPPVAQSTPAKKELVAKVLQLQQSGIETVARGLVERPALMLMQGASNVMQTRIPPDKREAIAKDIQADVKKYGDEVLPLIRDRAIKLAPTTIGPLLEERFTEDELKQLIAIIESPVNRKYQQMGGEFQTVLTEKLVAETKASIEPKIKALDQTIVGRLGLPPPASAADPATATPAPAAASKPPARAASK